MTAQTPPTPAWVHMLLPGGTAGGGHLSSGAAQLPGLLQASSCQKSPHVLQKSLLKLLLWVPHPPARPQNPRQPTFPPPSIQFSPGTLHLVKRVDGNPLPRGSIWVDMFQPPFLPLALNDGALSLSPQPHLLRVATHSSPDHLLPSQTHVDYQHQTYTHAMGWGGMGWGTCCLRLSRLSATSSSHCTR